MHSMLAMISAWPWAGNGCYVHMFINSSDREEATALTRELCPLSMYVGLTKARKVMSLQN